MSNRLFLTGHKGFIGSHLYPKLIEQGYEVETDMRFLEIKKWDCIVHLAATTHTRTAFDPNIYYNNVLLTHKILSQPCRVVYASSCSAAHDTNPYAQSKIWAEHLGEKHGNALGLRFFNVYGSGNNKGIVWFLMNQKDGAKITIRGPELVRDYIAVQDCVDAIISVIPETKTKMINVSHCRGPKCKPIMKEMFMGYNRGVIDIGTGVGTSTLELVSLFTKLSGKKFEIETIPPDPSEPLSMIADRPFIGATSLEDGLIKMQVCTWNQPVLSDIYNHIKNNK